MLREMLIIALVLSAVFVSGCTRQVPSGGEPGGAVEEQAYRAIEQEMEEAIENITLEDIEQALTE